MNLYEELDAIRERKPQLFSPHTVRFNRGDMSKMHDFSRLIFNVIHSDSYNDILSKYRNDIASFAPGNLSAMIGFDFHITSTGPKLIEINTNAGGLMTSSLWRFRDNPADAEGVVARMVEMFRMEYADWNRPEKPPLRNIAIVDTDPSEEFTIDDFILTKMALENHGINACISRLDQLEIKGGRLFVAGNPNPIDLVYNRSCDFYFTSDETTTLREGYLSGIACVSPNPYGYGLLADKRNLAALYKVCSQDGADDINQDDKKLLKEIVLPTHILSEDQENLISNRNKWFFKPINAHAGIGAFRGDKISWKKIQQLDLSQYIAQETAKPDTLSTDNGPYKYDVRIFMHKGIPIDDSVRIYQGRLTNFRSEEGGYGKIEVA